MTIVHSTFPYELRIGVTGHRKLADPDGVRRAVARLLDRISVTLNQHDHTALEWTIVSPLAKGADRIVADAVLARPGSRLEVITPFAMEEYRKDFNDSEDLAEFERLLGRSDSTTAVEWSSDGDPSSNQEARNEGYLRVGEAVVEQSEIVIAVWDGREAAGRGGTGDIVRFAVRRNQVVLWINSDKPDSDPQLLITADSPEAGGPLGRLRSLPFPSNVKALSSAYHQLAAVSNSLKPPPILQE